MLSIRQHSKPFPLLSLLSALATACSFSAAANAASDQTATYPDWSGQWERIGSLNWPPEGYDKAGPAPLTPEYQAIYEQNLALRADGILAGDPPATCLPPGMPRMMKMSGPMEIIITPGSTYIYADWESQIRRFYTDGRDCPD